ncbi:hypothetical protein EJ05DRAFT_249774 [Pseudovirgaria hyperparasitica]|uniref:Protein kinase domain-containing protein n=1 Tax=Pseudovirgaria hyperparasitica TaxID=470096 RepID=A0A6A6WFQ8_9PEZI|nr:uncharacterized protein EJ05DRAFT_249774 [Pseudovirgaria hyperparasitica]KAF2761009.1 hypothetical protein EJ05DRAFT_249774 [Pseudovirgaria hyperparasitica]
MKSFPISVQRWWKRRIRARQDTRRKHELILTAQPTTSNSNRYENRNTFISQVDATPQPATPTTLVTAHKSDLPAQQTNPEPYSPVPQIDPVRWAEKYQDIHDELNERFDRGEIFPDSEVQSFWRKHKHFYAGQRWYIHFCASVNYITPYLKILMILTLCKYSDWDSLPRVFNENMQRSDEYLPFNKEALNQPHFLRAHAVPFYKFQWAFCPLVITRFHEEIHLGQGFCSPLPFTQASEKIGEGATASVTKEVIAAGHLKYSDGTLVTFTRKPYAVACKNIMAKDVLYEEIQNLKKLRRSLSKHDHILVNFAILVEDHPVHTKWYRILLFAFWTEQLSSLWIDGPHRPMQKHRRCTRLSTQWAL